MKMETKVRRIIHIQDTSTGVCWVKMNHENPEDKKYPKSKYRGVNRIFTDWELQQNWLKISRNMTETTGCGVW